MNNDTRTFSDWHAGQSARREPQHMGKTLAGVLTALAAIFWWGGFVAAWEADAPRVYPRIAHGGYYQCSTDIECEQLYGVEVE